MTPKPAPRTAVRGADKRNEFANTSFAEIETNKTNKAQQKK
jgi:hypothetical protein